MVNGAFTRVNCRALRGERTRVRGQDAQFGRAARGPTCTRLYRPTKEIAVAEIEAQAAMAMTVADLTEQKMGRPKKSASMPTLPESEACDKLKVSTRAVRQLYTRWSLVAAIPQKVRAR